ncbi:MAG: outer membrane lipoprotein carrier protein [Halioglobus sp.]|jgi:chaperone LolA
MKISIYPAVNQLWKITLAALCAVSLNISAAAEGAEESAELSEILSRTTTLQGLFSQRQYDDKGVLLSESSGRFGLLRPGYFFWHIESPDSQSIIANPKYLWHHDLDLETVTRRPVTDSSMMSPLQILGGDLSALALRFSVEKMASGTFSLTALDVDTVFESLTLTFDGDNISRLDIIDTLSQRIDIRFDGVTDTPALTAEDFSFAPPAGVDLFYYDD